MTGARQTAGKCPGKNKLDREKEAANAIAAGFGSYISAMWTKASVASFSLSEARFFAGAEEDPPGAAGRLLGLPN